MEEKKHRTLKRAYGVTDILNYEPVTLPFEGAWRDLIGLPELSGCWIIYGEPANGKTSFAMQLAKYLASFEKVIYNSIEEGMSFTIKKAVKRVGMRAVSGRFFLLHKEEIKEVEARLRKKGSPNVVIFDSLQYMGMNKDQIKALVDRYPEKLFIFISHADGDKPKGATAESVKYHANVKIRVAGYRAFALTRYSDGSASIPLTIWEKGANDYYQETNKDNENGQTQCTETMD